MNIPKNGRIVVIDDNYEEAIPLLKVLAKSKIPSMYFSGLAEELPANTLENIRLVFLDLKLVSVIDEKTVISAIISVLEKIISKQNGPYILILWSMHDIDYRKGLEDSFQNQLSGIKPIMILTLKKTDYIERDDGEKINFVKNALKLIENKLIQELKKAGIFHLFIIWENLVHKSAGKIVNDFSSFYPLDENWNNNMCGVFKKLARAYAGKQLEDEDADKLIKDALFTFNGTFLDTLENEISNKKIEGLKINDSNNVNDDIAAQINSKLHLIFQPPKNSVPGNIYKWENQMKINDLFNGDIDLYPQKQKDSFLNKLKYILLEVSPSCDYAQDKWKLHRVLHGLMWPENDFNKIKKKADYIYTSPIFKVDNKIYKFVFDLRYLTTLSLDELKDKKPVLRIRHDLLVDIQSKIAGHINRPGVICLEQKKN